MNKLIILSIPAFLMLITSCASVLYVAPRKAECTESADEYCYLVRTSTEGNWVMLNNAIDGFDYEPGFSYKIKVKKQHIKDPAVIGPRLKYTMTDLIEKRDVTTDIDSEDLVGKDWKLEYFKTDGINFGFETKAPFIRFGVDGKVNGFAGCNQFNGDYELSGRTIKFGGQALTRMHCEESADLEDAFTKALTLVWRGLFSDSKLILTADGGNQMILTYK